MYTCSSILLDSGVNQVYISCLFSCRSEPYKNDQLLVSFDRVELIFVVVHSLRFMSNCCILMALPKILLSSKYGVSCFFFP